MSARTDLEQAKVLLGRRAEGGPDLSTLLDSGRRYARESGAPTDASGLPVAGDQAQNRIGNSFRRQLVRLALNQASAQGPGAFDRLAGALTAPQSSQGAGQGVADPSSGLGTPVGLGQQPGPLARVTTGMNRTDRNITRGIQMGLGPLGFVPGLARMLFGDTPGVIGSPAPKIGTEDFRQNVRLGREARSLGGGGGFGGGFGHYGGPR